MWLSHISPVMFVSFGGAKVDTGGLVHTTVSSGWSLDLLVPYFNHLLHLSSLGPAFPLERARFEGVGVGSHERVAKWSLFNLLFTARDGVKWL